MSAMTTASVRLLTGLIGVAAAAVLAFGVWPTAVGPSGLDLGYGLPRAFGPQPVPSVEVRPGDGFTERQQSSGYAYPQMFTWTQASDGTRDAATGLPPVELFTPSMGLSILAPSWAERIGLAGPRLATQGLILWVLWLLWRIVRTVPSVFTTANTRRIVHIGLIVAIGGSSVQLLSFAAHQAIVASSAAAGILEVVFSFSFTPLITGTIVLLLAAALRQGVRLRADLDALESRSG